MFSDVGQLSSIESHPPTKFTTPRAMAGRMLSASIAVYRPKAELFGGRSDGKFVVRLGKYQHCQALIIAGDN
jgi:hypothetical protein